VRRTSTGRGLIGDHSEEGRLCLGCLDRQHLAGYVGRRDDGGLVEGQTCCTRREVQRARHTEDALQRTRHVQMTEIEPSLAVVGTRANGRDNGQSLEPLLSSGMPGLFEQPGA
jgi:hypothetical protein